MSARSPAQLTSPLQAKEAQWKKPSSPKPPPPNCWCEDPSCASPWAAGFSGIALESALLSSDKRPKLANFSARGGWGAAACSEGEGVTPATCAKNKLFNAPTNRTAKCQLLSQLLLPAAVFLTSFSRATKSERSVDITDGDQTGGMPNKAGVGSSCLSSPLTKSRQLTETSPCCSKQSLVNRLHRTLPGTQPTERKQSRKDKTHSTTTIRPPSILRCPKLIWNQGLTLTYTTLLAFYDSDFHGHDFSASKPQLVCTRV